MASLPANPNDARAQLCRGLAPVSTFATMIFRRVRRNLLAPVKAGKQGESSNWR
jgi:hypothetical protein